MAVSYMDRVPQALLETLGIHECSTRADRIVDKTVASIPRRRGQLALAWSTSTWPSIPIVQLLLLD